MSVRWAESLELCCRECTKEGINEWKKLKQKERRRDG